MGRRASEKICPVDPPYWGCEDDYGKEMFSRGDFERMEKQLGKIDGRFLKSINDVPENRGLFGGFHIGEVETTYTIGRQNRSKRSTAELLNSNFKWGG